MLALLRSCAYDTVGRGGFVEARAVQGGVHIYYSFYLFSCALVTPRRACIGSFCSRTADLVLFDLVETQSEHFRNVVERT